MIARSASDSGLGERWWERATAITRATLKVNGRTLVDLIAELDDIQELGFEAIELFAPCSGGTTYEGLDTIDFYEVDPAIGTMADFSTLVREAHLRNIAIVAFLNVGYVHEEYPAFLRACDDIAEGRATDDSKLFFWSDSPDAPLPFEPNAHFRHGAEGRWHWSERAQSYYWVKWEGESGGHALPQLNWADRDWRHEASAIVDFWMVAGADGVVLDAVNWYVGCDWSAIRDVTSAHVNAFTHPEGAGGFADDPVPWITDGGFTVLMDYGLKIWWSDKDVVRDAVVTGDFEPLEQALKQYRDPVDASGGTCYINPPRLRSQDAGHARLASAVVATVGELFFDGFGVASMSSDERAIVQEMLHLRREYRALTARGDRTQVPCDHASVYAFLRGSGPERVLVALNFSSLTAQGNCSIPIAEAEAARMRVPVLVGPHDFAIMPLPESDNPVSAKDLS